MAQFAYEMPFKSITLTKPAALDLSAARHTFVTIGSDGNIAVAAAGTNPVGVLQQPGEPDKGPMDLPAMVAGISFIKLGGTVAPGDDVEVGTNGTAIKKNTGITAGKCMVGGVAGDIGCILLQ